MIEAIWTGLRLPAGGFQNVVAAPVAPDGKMRAIGPFVAIAHAQPTLLAPGALPLDDDGRRRRAASASWRLPGGLTRPAGIVSVGAAVGGAIPVNGRHRGASLQGRAPNCC
jgi:hypothetical protein